MAAEYTRISPGAVETQGPVKIEPPDLHHIYTISARYATTDEKTALCKDGLLLHIL